MWIILLLVASAACESTYVSSSATATASASAQSRPRQPVCPKNEYYEVCPPSCPATDGCSLLWSKFNCTQKETKCKVPPACRCKSGFFRNKEGKCVTAQECMGQPSCGYNEEPVPCKTICPPQSCDLPYTDYLCTQDIKCVPGCDCIKDHWRNSSGICVPQNECEGPSTPTPETKCGYNEKPVDCVRTCPPEVCEALYVDYLCAYKEPNDCDKGCMCLDNHLRNSSGICVPVDQCPPAPWIVEPAPICKQNETYVECKQQCPPQSCEISYTTYMCPKPNEKPACEPGCDCKLNYLRNSTGSCILNDDCPPPPFNNPDTTTTPAPLNLNCSANETEAMCKRLCPPQSCDAKYAIYECNIPLPCIPGCNCKENFYRNKDGVCIPSEECPPPSTSPGTTSSPPVTQPPKTTPRPPCKAYAVATASSEGSGTNSSSATASCSPWEPPPKDKCSKNEVFVRCKVECPNSYCPVNDNRGILICDPPYPCPGGCVCNVGFRRKSYKNNTCIPSEECPPVKCSRQNEEWNPCPPPCFSEYCGDAGKPPVVCNTLVKNCQPQCVCKKGFYRNDSDICVPLKECPPKTTTPPPTTTVKPVQQCNANETYVQCRVDCPTVFCAKTEFDPTIQCLPQNPCPPGCVCTDPNYRRRSTKDRTCIPIEECPPVKCSNQNEVWDPCTNSCLFERCEDIGKPFAPCFEKRKLCRPKCVCKNGYYRNSSSICVPASECKTTTTTEPPTTTTAPSEPECPKNQTTVFCTFKCPNQFCPKTDSRLQLACKPPRDCPSGCGCKIGYKYKSSKDLTCVLGEDCPPVECTRPNEEWNPCPSGCLDESCENSNAPPSVCNELIHNCEPRCTCKQGFFRNESDICVPKEKCFENKCNVNETYVPCTFDCPTNFCPRSEFDTMIACSPPYPCNGGCICKDSNSRRRSTEDRTCIPIEQCPPLATCSVNETYVKCLNAGCQNYYCPTNENQGLIVPCALAVYCPAGCMCNPGFKWKSMEERFCIPAEECPPITCSNPNEVYNPCATSCLAESCDDANKPPVPCSEFQKYCQPKCVCAEGYYRNGSYVCVPASECRGPVIVEPPTTTVSPPATQCGVNETTVDCTFKCPYHYCPMDDEGIIYACKPPRDCPSGCGCKLGYRYKSFDDPTCILAEDCPPVKCTRKNEIWARCPSGCLDESCANADNPPAVCNELVHNCQPKCICKKGFFKNDLNFCVPKKDCKKCGANERYVNCKAGCPTDYCPTDDSRGIIACDPPYPCPGGCICNLNYKWASYENQTCILASDCPPVKCTRKNEVWSRCPSPCLVESCDSARRPTVRCDYLVQNCQPRCVCAKGYFRNQDDLCVRANKCPPPSS